jgi:transposase-like protein
MRVYSTEEAARAFFEELRWPDGPVCPYCCNDAQTRIYKVAANSEVGTREGLYKCAECSQHFTVTVGTVMHDSHIPLTKWLLGFYIINASKTQVSALQLQRMLELGSYRTAWHMCHRIRFALADLRSDDKLDGEVEADETYIGGKARGKGRGYTGNKVAVVSMVERGGRVRSHIVGSDRVSGAQIGKILRANVAKSAHLNTDESNIYTQVGKSFASHETVNHSEEEYARQDTVTGRVVTTNAAEGYFGNSKRSIDGTHHHVSKKYLPLYMAELDHKYNTRKVTDGERTAAGIRKAEGKRLTLKPIKK